MSCPAKNAISCGNSWQLTTAYDGYIGADLVNCCIGSIMREQSKKKRQPPPGFHAIRGKRRY